MGVVVLVDRPGYRVAADRKVLKSSEAAVIGQTAQAYLLAQEQINSALADLQHVCAQASHEAYRDGMAQAEQDAARRWTLAEVDRLSMLKSMQPALADIVVDAVELLARQIDREAFIAHALEVLQTSLRNASWAQLRVHPLAVPATEAALSEFDRRTGLGKIARIVSDDSLSEDSCVLESERGRIDASLATQLEAIRGAIAEAAQKAASAGAPYA
jgi:type III secretion protein L